MAYDSLKDRHKDGNTKEYLKILELAAKENEALVDSAIEKLIREEREISFETINALVHEGLEPERIRDIKILTVDTKVYDVLLACNQEGVAA